MEENMCKELRPKDWKNVAIKGFILCVLIDIVLIGIFFSRYFMRCWGCETPYNLLGSLLLVDFLGIFLSLLLASKISKVVSVNFIVDKAVVVFGLIYLLVMYIYYLTRFADFQRPIYSFFILIFSPPASSLLFGLLKYVLICVWLVHLRVKKFGIVEKINAITQKDWSWSAFEAIFIMSMIGGFFYFLDLLFGGEFHLVIKNIVVSVATFIHYVFGVQSNDIDSDMFFYAIGINGLLMVYWLNYLLIALFLPLYNYFSVRLKIESVWKKAMILSACLYMFIPNGIMYFCLLSMRNGEFSDFGFWYGRFWDFAFIVIYTWLMVRKVKKLEKGHEKKVR